MRNSPDYSPESSVSKDILSPAQKNLVAKVAESIRNSPETQKALTDLFKSNTVDALNTHGIDTMLQMIRDQGNAQLSALYQSYQQGEISRETLQKE